MTPTKIKKKLIELCDKLGHQTECYIFHDEWADGEPVRETITLGDVINLYDDKTSGTTSNYQSHPIIWILKKELPHAHRII